MKHKILNMAAVLLACLAITACSPEEYSGADGNIPQASDYAVAVTVDQEKNVATFNLVDKDGNRATGVYPCWEIDAGTTLKSTVNGYTTPFITFAGTYSYKARVGNRNDISYGVIEGTFTINTTRFDFSDFVSKLTANGTKEWRVFSAQSGHLGCGPSISDPSSWWSAAPDDKAKEGIYDDRITFTTGSSLSAGSYEYSAGEDGKTFCNKGVTSLGVTDAAEDYSTPCVGVNGAQTKANYSLGYDSGLDMITVTLPAKTLFPYIADNEQFDKAVTFYVTDINDKTMTWVVSLPGICWQIIFVNGDDPVIDFDVNKVNWCSVDSPLNLGKAFNDTGSMAFYFADAGWTQIQDPDFSYANGVYTITTKDATAQEWQGQCTIGKTPLTVEAGEYYDISCKVVASQAVSRVTIKINKDPETESSDVSTLFYKNNFALKAGENTLRFAKFTPTNTNTKEPISFDSAKFVLDIGGCPAGVKLELSDIIIQKHNPK